MKTKKTIGWVLTGLVLAFLLMDSIFKLIQAEAAIQGTVELGYSADSVLTLGIILLVVTILYALPRTAVIGMILLTAYLGGAVATHVRVENPLATHTLFPIYLALIAWTGLVLRNEKLILFLTNKP